MDLILEIMEASFPTSSDNNFWFARSFIFKDLIFDFINLLLNFFGNLIFRQAINL